ncbi:hypothetical protein ST37_09005 [Vibrio sp. qd031]|uniref:hypothetical protein n=1 Tax=Vibrio sp. qd031 TaxID=1603038 RepID=UPI000A10E543|nr:hypothetical protein [Vibrio sp. qd031]ORT50048.1 hypothetical protein ST37_09005 [Vibrio sp. qd031]
MSELLNPLVAKAGDEDYIPLDSLVYLPVVPNSPKTMCIGRNNAAHAVEGGAEPPTYPEILLCSAASVIGHPALSSFLNI